MANTTGNKYGGREKGAPNKLTKEIRKNLKDLIYRKPYYIKYKTKK
tara:strand:+ start:219 stop:356 length:138 start_codon:yes stop_codon:yes gene_type:complete